MKSVTERFALALEVRYAYRATEFRHDADTAST